MKNPRLPLSLLASLTLCLAACNTPNPTPPATANTNAPAAAASTAEDTSANAPKPDYKAIADKLVVQCGALKEGDLVSVNGNLRDAELLEEIAIAVRKQGAFPLLRFTTDKLERRLFTEVPAKYDAQIPELELQLAKLITAEISIDNIEDPARLADIPKDRQWARLNAGPGVQVVMTQRHVKRISVGGNGLYPRETNARELGIPLQQLAKIFWDGINVDYAQLHAIGEKYRQIFSAAKEAHITNPNGTDFTVKIEQRPIRVSDGVISPADVQRGDAQLWLPAGEVFTTPVPGTANGKLVLNRIFQNGEETEGLTLEFKAGKLVAMSAKTGGKQLREDYEAAGGDKSAFCLLDLGINQNITLGANARRGDYPVAGMVTIGFGGNEYYGGEFKSGFRFEGNMPGCTLKLDGKTIVENGALKQ